MIVPSNYFPNWQNNRINFILSKYPESFFSGKRILELAPCNGYIGAFFQSIGADVVSIEGRADNILNINKNYPNLKCEIGNLDTPKWNYDKYDIIINFGLFYHLDNFHKEHLENCVDNCDLMFFESVIYDSYHSVLYYRYETGYDQSLSYKGGAPSTSYIENIFINKNKKFEKFSNSSLNAEGHFYDWTDTGNNIYNAYQRRFWIVE